jgi:hypothetical protein
MGWVRTVLLGGGLENSLELRLQASIRFPVERWRFEIALDSDIGDKVL